MELKCCAEFSDFTRRSYWHGRIHVATCVLKHHLGYEVYFSLVIHRNTQSIYNALLNTAYDPSFPWPNNLFGPFGPVSLADLFDKLAHSFL